MIRIGWWLDTHGVAQREAALGFNEVALEHGWSIGIGSIDPSFRKEDCDAHVVGAGVDKAVLDWMDGRLVVSAEQDLTGRGFASVHSDYASAGQMAAEHLLQRGIGTFAGFGMSAEAFWLERCRAFRGTVERAGARYIEGAELVDVRTAAARRGRPAPSSFGIRSVDALMTWLAGLPSPVGIFTGADAWGMLLLPFVHRAGRQVPTDVAVIGVDNDEFNCELTHPSLSSVIIPWRQVGRRAGDLLHRMLGGERVEVRRYIVPPAGIIARRSTDMLAVPDHDVASALAFIQRSYREDITVTDVLRAVPTHRKRLESGFRKHVGHGIMREIRRVRVERARQLLIMTDMPLEGVAQRAGFVSAQKMTEFFSKIVGTPPSRYRREFRLGRGKKG